MADINRLLFASDYDSKQDDFNASRKLASLSIISSTFSTTLSVQLSIAKMQADIAGSIWD
jgi:hypothetical protein